MFDMLVASGWQALAAIGIMTIVLGSLLERFGPALRMKVQPDKGLSAAGLSDKELP